MRENKYQAWVIDKIGERFPGSVVIKNDPQYQQGILDLTILFNDRWAMLEVKASAAARFRPNQLYYIDLFNEMSYAAAIYPENESEILDELEQAFTRSRR